MQRCYEILPVAMHPRTAHSPPRQHEPQESVAVMIPAGAFYLTFTRGIPCLGDPACEVVTRRLERDAREDRH
jgi:hypothetical protein